MTGRWTAMAMALLCAVQIGVPAGMIARREITLRGGEPFRFRCAPVDPADPFRGRYVALAFDVERIETPVEAELSRGQTVYGAIEVDGDGFARIAAVVPRRPDGGAFVRCRVRQVSGGRVLVDLPFDRYYLSEGKASDAERAYRESLLSGPGRSWVGVRVLDGYAVLDELYVDGVPVRALPNGDRVAVGAD